jgi:hypothetical protein
MRRILPASLLLAAAFGAHAAGFTLSSPTVKPGATLTSAQVFKGFGCEGQNTSPALKWSGEPAGTKSFAVTVYDPDPPTASGFWHWAVANIPASVTELPSGAGDKDAPQLPERAVQLSNDAGFAGFVGAAPPAGHGPHRYFMVVHGRALFPDFLDEPAEFARKLLGEHGLRLVLVDHALGGGFERRRDSPGGLGDIGVGQAGESVRAMARDDRLEEEEQLVLPLGQCLNRGQQQGQVGLLPAPDHRRRVCAGRRQVNAGFRAVDLDQAFCSATDRADGTAEGGAVPACLPMLAEWADHPTSLADACRKFRVDPTDLRDPEQSARR